MNQATPPTSASGMKCTFLENGSYDFLQNLPGYGVPRCLSETAEKSASSRTPLVAKLLNHLSAVANDLPMLVRCFP
jgi:hypothetical protein